MVRDYSPSTGWTIDLVPENSGFPDDIVTLILGSRKPILFVEGTESSLDRAIYRACFPDWTVVSRGSCEQVIHSVGAMRANKMLTSITCAGIVDADDYQIEEIDFLARQGIGVLPVAEIENLFMLPSVIDAILAIEGFEGAELTRRRETLTDELFCYVRNADVQRSSILRFCRRRIDRALKKVDLSASKDVTALHDKYTELTSEIDVEGLAQVAQQAIKSAVERRDVALLLKWLDNKGLMSIAAKAKGTKRELFEQWIVRTMRNSSAPQLYSAIGCLLPSISAR